MRHLKPPPHGSYSVVCPHCKAQNAFGLADDYTDVLCPSCKRRFRIFLATVRGKRDRVSGSQREYVIRAVTDSGEKELRFVDYGGSDLSLRSSDIMYTCYRIYENVTMDAKPAILGNLTINQYVEIKPSPSINPSRCFIATVACGHDSLEVKTLTSFRDRILSKSGIGLLFISLYYWFSPFLASYLSKKERLKKNTRIFLVSPMSTLISELFQIEKKGSFDLSAQA